MRVIWSKLKSLGLDTRLFSLVAHSLTLCFTLLSLMCGFPTLVKDYATPNITTYFAPMTQMHTQILQS